MPIEGYNYSIHKFGGSSLANAERFVATKSLISGNNEVIVVSAVQGVTSALQDSLDAAKENKSFKHELSIIENNHIDIINDILSDNADDLIRSIQSDIGEITDILHTVQLTHSYSKQIQDIVLGYGEIWSAKILTAYLSNFMTTVYVDASEVIFVYEHNRILCVDWPRSEAALEGYIKGEPFFNVMVVTGFIASTLDGQRTTLGRNGSDFSGAILAKLLNAKSLTIWTDVDGIYSADPNRVKSAFVIDFLSYKEALELAYFGAKVLHPMTIAPLLEAQIPIFIKNSLNPKSKGTCISVTPRQSPHIIKGLTCIDNIALINIEGAGMIGVSGIAARIFEVLHQADISVILISQASSEHSICFAVSNKYSELAAKALSENLQLELQRQQVEGIYVDNSCAILAVVGDQMVGAIGISSRLCDSLAKANINIRAISQGSSERNISVVIHNNDINRALTSVHAGFYLSRKSISIGLIGPGNVGSTLLKQIYQTLEELKSKSQVNLYVRGIMNSKKMLLSHTPIDLSSWEKQLNESSVETNVEEFASHILSDDVPQAVIIDCTASNTISQYYIDFFERGIHVITPNKHANSGELAYYKKIKSITQNKNKHYLYEATVCAGLPIINTLQDLIKTGDTIEKIEGVVSGTLSYIFNELSSGKPFSEIVLDAINLGYTEPDPREDLSGIDVARKLVCLAREIGYDVSLEDVNVYNLVPEELRLCGREEFLTKLPNHDQQIATQVTEAFSHNKKLCYVGTIDHEGKMRVAIESIPQEHVFSTLTGSDNMLILHTRRYHDHPLIIRGPGAGAEVTAAGIFADLLRLVSYLS